MKGRGGGEGCVQSIKGMEEPKWNVKTENEKEKKAKKGKKELI